MANIRQSLQEAMSIDGALATALVDYETGLTLGTAGGGANLNIEMAAAGNTEVVRAKLKAKEMLGIKGPIEDILITLEGQLHLIRLLGKHKNLFMYVALDRSRGNLGMARFHLKEIEQKLEI